MEHIKVMVQEQVFSTGANGFTFNTHYNDYWTTGCQKMIMPVMKQQ